MLCGACERLWEAAGEIKATWCSAPVSRHRRGYYSSSDVSTEHNFHTIRHVENRTNRMGQR